MKWLTSLLVLSVFVFANFFATDWFVDDVVGNDLNSGASWGTAKKTISAAISASNVGDAIYVAEGIYDDEPVPLDVDKDALKIFGGYTTGGGERNPSLYITNLTGSFALRLLGTGLSDTDRIIVSGITITNSFQGIWVAATCNWYKIENCSFFSVSAIDVRTNSTEGIIEYSSFDLDANGGDVDKPYAVFFYSTTNHVFQNNIVIKSRGVDGQEDFGLTDGKDAFGVYVGGSCNIQITNNEFNNILGGNGKPFPEGNGGSAYGIYIDGAGTGPRSGDIYINDNTTIYYDKKNGHRILMPKSTNPIHESIIPKEGDIVQGIVQEIITAEGE